MKKMTEANVAASFAGESQAHLKYLNFAERAEKEGYPNVARLFQAAAFSEQIHASNHLKALEGIQGTAANLAEAMGGELFEVEEMYVAYMAVAEVQAEKRALRSMGWALEAEKVHGRLYGQAEGAVKGGQDMDPLLFHVCPACGFTMEGEAPDACPLCGAKRDRFHRF